MALITNQATLSYNNTSTLSNIATSELLEVLTVSKTALEESYQIGEPVTYAINIVNTGGQLTGLTLTDDLGAYAFGTGSLTPLTYVVGSVRLFINGVLQETNPTVTVNSPLTITGLSIPAGGNALLLYRATPNTYADPLAGGTITNTATLSSPAITPIEADTFITVSEDPLLTVTKTASPDPVVSNSTLTYTFTLYNYGNTDADAGDNTSISDRFTPALQNITVTFGTETWDINDDYTYTSGNFVTTPGRLLVPKATATYNQQTGAYTITPGTATLTVSGTV